MRRNVPFFPLLLLLFLELSTGWANAQTYSGALRGRVTDAAQHPIAGADVVVTNTGTNAISRSKTSGSGDYTVSFLNEGFYRIEISAKGFRTYIQSGFQLDLNQRATLDAALQVGQVTEDVVITGSATELNEVSSEIGDVIDQERLTELPLQTGSNGRSPLLLAKLSPGVTSTSANNSNINNFSLGGGRPVSNEILVDGLPTTNPSDETYTLTPAPEALSEMKVITTPFSAQYGHTGGGVLLLTTNAGTSELHGSVFDFHRNRIFNGRNYFSTKQSQIKYVLNDPGMTLGGPLPLPWEKKRKTFFFGSYNITLLSQGNSYNALTPTDAQKQGDFSSLLDRTTSYGVNPCDNTPIYAGQIFDPSSVQTLGDTVCRKAFTNNIIPSSRFDTVGKKLIAYFPEPNGNFSDGAVNYQVYPVKFHSTGQWMARVDHNFSDNDKMFFRVGGYHPAQNAPTNIPNAANNTTADGWVDTQAVISETHVFAPNLFNDFRIGFIQEHNFTSEGDGSGTALGLSGVSLLHFPSVSTTNYADLGSDSLFHDRDRSWIYSDAINWQVGAHALMIGGEYRRQMYSSYDPGKTAGNYSFAPSFSAYPGNSNTGLSLADMLLGLPTETDIQIANYAYKQNINSASLYLQDDWKISRRLTLNLGMRWEYDGPYTEDNNQFYTFNPDLIDPTTQLKGAAQFAGQNGAPKHFTANIYHNFLPRVGFSWKVRQNTVLRGGYGIYRLPNIGYYSYGLATKYGINTTFSSNDNNITPYYQLQNGVPAYAYNVDANGNADIPTSVTDPTSEVYQLEMRTRTPYDQNYQFGIQQQLPHGWFFEADYQGAKGTKLPALYNLNQLHSSQYAVDAKQSSRPYPQFKAVHGLLNQAGSNYQALESKLTHRFQDGFVTELAYTFSKFIDDVDATERANNASTQDAYNMAAERGLGGYDVPHRLVASYFWKLPVGRGGKYLAGTPILKDILGGWSASGILEFQSGLAMTITQPSNQLGGFNDIQRPNQIGDPILSRDRRSLTHWFNTGAFTAASALQPGTAKRFPLHGPGLENWDQAISRTFPIHERMSLQFRTEFFNSLNHTNFKTPGKQIGSSGFGKVTSALDPRIIEFAGKLQF